MLQQIADVILGATLRGVSPLEHFAKLATPEGVVYAALLALFAVMPALTSEHPASKVCATGCRLGRHSLL